jgi:porphobilinogen synthase
MIIQRPRRNRANAAIRDMIQETQIVVSDFIFPMFIQEGSNLKIPIQSMPGQYRFSTDTLLEELKSVQDLGIKGICLFPNYPDSKKDKWGSESTKKGTLYLIANDRRGFGPIQF